MCAASSGREIDKQYAGQNYQPKLRVVKTSEPIKFFPQQLTEDYF